MMPASYELSGAWIVEPDRIENRNLAICGGRVSCSASADDPRISLQDHLIFPGLINAHDHLHRNAIPRFRHPSPFANSYAWIEAIQCHLCHPEVQRVQALPSVVRHWHGALKNLLSGVTTVAHHDPWHCFLEDPDFPVRVVSRYGWAHSLRLGELAGSEFSHQYGPPVKSSYDGTPADHPWIIHLAEGWDETAAGEFTELMEAGCVGPNTVLVHGVGLTEEDQHAITTRQAGVVWCPSSNLRMLGRTLNPTILYGAGRLALGTDSRLTGSRDMLQEMRIAGRCSSLTSRDLLRLVTTAPAHLLRMPGAGSLRPGAHADLLVLSDDCSDPYDRLLHTWRADIRAVVRNGLPLIADPDLGFWFELCGVPSREIRLDGRPKRCAESLLRYPEAAALERGLEVER
jgi:cytosine/adenosine deaminase-related metal-dependent hydrolase